MTINTKYNIGDKVTVRGTGIDGTIAGIKITTDDGIAYLVPRPASCFDKQTWFSELILDPFAPSIPDPDGPWTPEHNAVIASRVAMRPPGSDIPCYEADFSAIQEACMAQCARVGANWTWGVGGRVLPTGPVYIGNVAILLPNVTPVVYAAQAASPAEAVARAVIRWLAESEKPAVPQANTITLMTEPQKA